MSDSQPANEASTWDDSRITAYVMDELDPRDREVFEDELAGDAKLQMAVDQAREVTAQLQGLYGDEPTVVLDAQRRDAILSSNEEALVGLAEPSSQSGSRHKVAWVLAAAAAILLAIGLVPRLNKTKTVLVPPDEIQDSREEKQFDVEEGERLESSAGPGRLGGGAAESSAATSMQESSSIAPSPALGLGRGRDQNRQAGVAPMALNSAESSAIESKESITPRSKNDQAAQPLLSKPQSAAPMQPSQTSGQSPVSTRFDASNRGSATYELSNEGMLNEGTITGKEQTALDHPFQPLAENGATTLEGLAPKSMPVPADANEKRAIGGQGFSTELMKNADGEQPVPELGQIIIKGRKKDVAKVQDMLRLLEQSAADGDRFEPIIENEFKSVSEHPLSTFSIDVDTASYSKVRQILNAGNLPRPDAVRAEELINYFDYRYDSPAADAEHPFAADVTITNCPWKPEHRLARVAIQGKRLQPEQRPACNLVFLLDTSGSMNAPNKLPLVIDGMKMLTKQLGENDRVAIVVYAGSAGLVLESTPAAKQKKIRRALNQLSAGGSTNGEAGIQLAYTTARDNFIDGGVNRVILCTDGDFNVGTQNTGDLVRLIKEEASSGIFLTALGFGMGNHNDAMMERISGEGNGNYAFIDTANEARKVLVRQTDSTLVTIAKDVKLQLEFNPRLVSAYRLIGYENRVMAKEDFNDDQKDAGEIGAGHQVTAFYELVPGDTAASPATESNAVAESVPTELGSTGVDPLKYQTSRQLSEAASSNESMTIKLRYKQPESDTSTKVEFKAIDEELKFDAADDDFQFAAAVASFAMQLRNSKFAGNWTLENVAETVAAHQGDDEFGLRREFESLVGKAARLKAAE